MKNNNKLIPLIVIVCSFSTNHANAQGNWGKKQLVFLKSRIKASSQRDLDLAKLVMHLKKHFVSAQKMWSGN